MTESGDHNVLRDKDPRDLFGVGGIAAMYCECFAANCNFFGGANQSSDVVAARQRLFQNGATRATGRAQKKDFHARHLFSQSSSTIKTRCTGAMAIMPPSVNCRDGETPGRR